MNPPNFSRYSLPYKLFVKFHNFTKFSHFTEICVTQNFLCIRAHHLTSVTHHVTWLPKSSPVCKLPFLSVVGTLEATWRERSLKYLLTRETIHQRSVKPVTTRFSRGRINIYGRVGTR